MTRMGDWQGRAEKMLRAAALAGSLTCFMALGSQAQSAGGQTQNPPPASSQPAQDIPDAPSTVQPPPPKPVLPAASPDSGNRAEPSQTPSQMPNQDQQDQSQTPGQAPGSSSSQSGAQSEPGTQPPAPVPPGKTAAGSTPRNQINPAEGLYKFVITTNRVELPVMVKDSQGRPVDGLLPKDFTVLENGKKQTLVYFTSDPYPLSVAILLDYGMPDVVVQKINQTYSALVGAFSPYDEVALYTYSSSVSQVTDYSSRSNQLTAALNQLKLARGRNSGPGVGGAGPLGTDGPMINGVPVGGPPIAPVNTPPREAHVLNDAILRAALDLSKRERGRRKVIFVISDGRDMGSQVGYRDVLRVLETHDIQVRAVVVGNSALPIYHEIEKIHLRGQGYSDILPKYSAATGGGQVSSELTRNSIEEAYAEITSEARNQYTLGYLAKPTVGSSAYRTIEVLVDKKGLKIAAKDGYYPIPGAH
jgi:VWFA-related protein